MLLCPLIGQCRLERNIDIIIACIPAIRPLFCSCGRSVDNRVTRPQVKHRYSSDNSEQGSIPPLGGENVVQQPMHVVHIFAKRRFQEIRTPNRCYVHSTKNDNRVAGKPVAFSASPVKPLVSVVDMGLHRVVWDVRLLEPESSTTKKFV